MIDNFIYLLLQQVARYVFPLITFPYLVRVLGVERFGLIAFSQAVILYFTLTVDYGFNLTATQQISVSRHNKLKIVEIFSTVLITKLVLAVISVIIMLLMILFVPIFRNEGELYLISSLTMIGSALMPLWYYQGLERMKLITIANIVSKAISVFLIFALVKERSDYLIVVWCQLVGSVFPALLSLFIAIYYYDIHIKIVSFESVRAAIRDGWHVFVSQISITLFTSSNTVILGLFTNNEQVGHFTIADKIVRAVVALITPLSGAIYPRISHLVVQSRQSALNMIRRTLTTGTLFFFIMCLGLFIFADKAVILVTGRSNSEINSLIRIMSVFPVTIFINNVYGTQIMLNMNLQREFMKSILITGLFSLILSLVLVPLLGKTGTAVSSLCAETLIMVLMIYYVNSARINIFDESHA